MHSNDICGEPSKAVANLPILWRTFLWRTFPVTNLPDTSDNPISPVAFDAELCITKTGGHIDSRTNPVTVLGYNGYAIAMPCERGELLQDIMLTLALIKDQIQSSQITFVR